MIATKPFKFLLFLFLMTFLIWGIIIGNNPPTSAQETPSKTTKTLVMATSPDYPPAVIYYLMIITLTWGANGLERQLKSNS